MDDSVIQSMAKWPNVPDCYGWLHLNAQGQWLMGEVGSATPPSVVAHAGLQGFMNRNYLCPFPKNAHPEHASAGAWALQNGPQRVWVTLSTAPLVVQLHQGVFTAHTGVALELSGFVLASDGVVYCRSAQGVGAIASRSMETFSQGVVEHGGALFWQRSEGAALMAIEHYDADLIETQLEFVRHL